MAKISAYGAVEIARWKRDDGATLVLTRKKNGRLRLLSKPPAGSYHEIGGFPTREKIDEWARQGRYVPVTVRS